MPALYTEDDRERLDPRDAPRQEKYRSSFRRDYARLLHSPSFRRLDGKTQLFPDAESDFFRNRLTHSLEVAQVAKSITIRLNEKGDLQEDIDTDLVEFAAHAHDLGHPPFGHNGEEALDECMAQYGGFEGNAQTLRIIARLEKKEAHPPPDKLGIHDDGSDGRLGLNPTYRSIASVLKYDRKIPIDRSSWSGVKKGYYFTEHDIVSKTKERVTKGRDISSFRTIECSIMDIADDIAYSTYDLEDAFQAGFAQPIDLLSIDEDTALEVSREVQDAMEKVEKNIRSAGFKDAADRYSSRIQSEEHKGEGYTSERVKEIMYDIFLEHIEPEAEERIEEEFTIIDDDAEKLDQDELVRLVKKMSSSEYRVGLASIIHRVGKSIADRSYRREEFTSRLIGQFIQSTCLLVNEDIPALSRAYIPPKYRERIEALKHYTFTTQIKSPRLQVVEYRGKDIVRSIFEALNQPDGERLLPEDYRLIHDRVREGLETRVICDFVAGMTDSYALDYYSRITSGDEQTIFKPY